MSRTRGILWSSAGTLAGLAGWLAASAYRHDIGAARERVARGGAVADTRHGPIEYALAGSGSPVLVVHGAGGGYDQGLDVGEPLIGKGFRLIAMSRFGYLRTPLPEDPSPEAQADAHASLLDTLGVSRAGVVGVSAGAPSALQFALRHPDRCAALVLLSPALYVPRKDESSSLKSPAWTQVLLDTALRSDFLFWLAMRTGRSLMIRSVLGTLPEVVEGATVAERAKVARTLEHILPVAPRRLGLLNDAQTVSSLAAYEPRDIKVPVLAVSMADDLYGTLEGARYAAEHIAGACFIGYSDGGHLCVGHTDAIISAIADFFASRHQEPP
jgi:2-hydroxy-6-oxonona-2,4-dienedioate hydrolase